MNLRIRTGYSFHSAAGKLEEVAGRIAETGSTFAPITDRASVFGWVRWGKTCKKLGLRPIYGVELAVSPSPEAKKPASDYWTFLARNSIAPINSLVTRATDQFRYEPLLTIGQATGAPDVVKIIGRRTNLSLVEPSENTYLFASPSAASGYLRDAVARGFPLVSSGDNVFPAEGDEGFYQVLGGRGANTQTWPQHILSDVEWVRAMRWSGLTESQLADALALTATVAEGCTAYPVKSHMVEPDRSVSLRTQCERGAVKLGIDLGLPVYAARLERELGLIADKKFEDYFFIVGDMVRWARERLVVGPARGSSCGSLVCYLLEITTIDPIPFDLLFERFIDINRNDLPDIDIDFSHVKRDLVFNYMKDTYGAERVARLGTVNNLGSSSAMNQASAALRIPKWKTSGVMESLVKRSSGDSRAMEALADAISDTDAGKRLLSEYPEIEIAGRMFGHPSHAGQHAAGIVITDKPVSEYVAIDSRTGATQCDKKDAEELDLLKIDALGLIQCSIFEDALALAGLPHNYLDTVPLDDPAAYAILNDHKYGGIFQVTGPAVKSLAQLIHFENIEDMIALTALARPGPFAAGSSQAWVKRRAGNEPVSYPHPVFIPDLERTLGVVIYQEQVMNIGRNVGDLSWDDVTALRKAMSKSLGKEFFDQFGDRWKAGARLKGVPDDVMNKVWDDLCAYGSWAFNRSHACAYGIVSYWCMWLKAHYPLEFAAATLQHQGSPDDQIALLRELNDEGIGYVPVHAAMSTDRWRVVEIDGVKKLVGPLTNVKGFGPKMVAGILNARARGEKISAKTTKLLADPVTGLDSLWPIRDAFNRLMPDPKARNIYTPPSTIFQVQNSQPGQTVLMLVTFAKINPRNENEAILVAKRGYAMPDNALKDFINITAKDDTGQMFMRVSHKNFDTLGRQIIDRGKPGKALYAVKGRSWGQNEFRGIMVEGLRYIGDL